MFIGCANDTGMSVEDNNVAEVETNINYTKYSNVRLYDKRKVGFYHNFKQS